MAEQLTTERLVLRPWRPDDAESALGIYGAAEVGRWLSQRDRRAGLGRRTTEPGQHSSDHRTSGLSPAHCRAVWSVTIIVAIVAVYGDATMSRV